MDKRLSKQPRDPRIVSLKRAHVRPLMHFVAKLRKSGLKVPRIDPNDAGVNAQVLILLESPGPKAVVSDFVSQDNLDWTARNMKRALAKAGLKRSQVVLWNVVPQSISSASRNRNATNLDVKNAVPHTQAFIELLPKLKVIIFSGRKAQRAIKHIKLPAKISILQTFHTGAQSYNHVLKREDIHRAFSKARCLIGEGP